MENLNPKEIAKKRYEAALNAIELINWHKVAQMYMAVKWRWASCYNNGRDGVPTATDLKNSAIRSASHLLEEEFMDIEDPFYTGTGGINILAFGREVFVFVGEEGYDDWLTDDEEIIKDIIE